MAGSPVVKPGAFENYRYRDALFPSHRFRMAYDEIRASSPGERASAARYLAILQLAAQTGEGAVDRALERILARLGAISVETVAEEVACEEAHHRQHRDAVVVPADLSLYDHLLSAAGEEVASL